MFSLIQLQLGTREKKQTLGILTFLNFGIPFVLLIVHRGRDRMVVGFTATCAISAYLL